MLKLGPRTPKQSDQVAFLEYKNIIGNPTNNPKWIHKTRAEKGFKCCSMTQRFLEHPTDPWCNYRCAAAGTGHYAAFQKGAVVSRGLCVTLGNSSGVRIQTASDAKGPSITHMWHWQAGPWCPLQIRRLQPQVGERLAHSLTRNWLSRELEQGPHDLTPSPQLLLLPLGSRMWSLLTLAVVLKTPLR